MIFFSWGLRSAPLGIESVVCEECHADKQQLSFIYRYFGIFWLGFSWNKTLAGQCITCGTSYVFPDAPADAMNELVSWNYRYGWIIWAALIGLAMLSAGAGV